MAAGNLEMRLPRRILGQIRAIPVFTGLHGSTTRDAVLGDIDEIEAQLERFGKTRRLYDRQLPALRIDLHDGCAESIIDLLNAATDRAQCTFIRRARRNHFKNLVLHERERFVAFAFRDVRNRCSNQAIVDRWQAAEANFTRKLPAIRIPVYPLKGRMTSVKRFLDVSPFHTK